MTNAQPTTGDTWLALVFLAFGAIGTYIGYVLGLGFDGMVGGFIIGGLIGLALWWRGTHR